MEQQQSPPRTRHPRNLPRLWLCIAIIVSSLALVQPTSATEASPQDAPLILTQFPDSLHNGGRIDALCLQLFPDYSRERVNLGLRNNAKEDLTLRLPAMVLDGPIARGQEQSWVFGGSARLGGWVATFVEPYTEGQAYITCGFENDFFILPQHRKVLYYDKGRIELLEQHQSFLAPSFPVGCEFYDEVRGRPLSIYCGVQNSTLVWSTDQPWTLTAGRLSWEMMTGQIQVGHADFVRREPAQIPIAGDPGSAGLTYAAMGQAMEFHRCAGPCPTGQPIHTTLDASGTIGVDPSLDRYGVTYVDTNSSTDFSVASVFWEFLARPGWHLRDVGVLSSYGPRGDASESLLGTPVYDSVRVPGIWVVGLPITEPFWTHVPVAGQPRWVLVQCFERRCLTYTPDNPEGWRVEFPNSGLHYLEWRYGYVPSAPDWATPWWDYDVQPRR